MAGKTISQWYSWIRRLAGREAYDFETGYIFTGQISKILDKIGSGGMSDVYKALCHKLKRQVAIKVLKEEFSSTADL